MNSSIQFKSIIPDLKAEDRESVIREMLEGIPEGAGINSEILVQVLLERERVGSTGVGNGVAIPHAKHRGIERITVCFGRSINGVDFNTVDNQPVHLFFLILASETMGKEYLHLLGRISRLLRNIAFRERLLEAGDSREIEEIFREV